MGVDLRDIVPREDIEFSRLHGKILSVDALNALYQFLAIIRQQGGEVLKDSKGRTTSHLSGLFYRTVNLVELGIRPLYIYDGRPPEQKLATLRGRKKHKDTAQQRAVRAKVEGRTEDYAKYASQSLTFTTEMLAESKDLLALMGIPFFDAPAEGEAQAAHLCATDPRIYAVASQDYDALLFGAPLLARNVTISGRRKLPGRSVYREVSPELLDLSFVLGELGITREQLVEVALLVGTDYNDGVKGLGPKKALEAVRSGTFDDYGVDPSLRDLFLAPAVSDSVRYAFSLPDASELRRFLCTEHDFSKMRVERAVERLTKGMEGLLRQETLDQWF
ncbi:MAG: flap endonuclease-1 [Candidatus Methanofastidiosa archaeon]|nr:flap endonuclease-1 [Candidatus Methanofastidiosa archaeon]